jgi:hypothetical protein
MTNWSRKKRNWDKPVKIEIEDEDRKHKAEKVAEFVEDQIGKEGKAAAGRAAFDLAFDKIQELEQEEEDKKEELAKYFRKVDQIADKLKK